MRILALDTSGPVAAVAIAEEDEKGYRKLTGGFRLQSGFTHSQTLMPMLENMKALADIDLATIDYIAVASGPGSFTGLRIGASAAKGLAFALEKQIVPVPTLDAMAFQMAGCDGLVCPMMDARREQVYTGLYRFEPGWRMVCEMEPAARALADYLPEVKRIYADRYRGLTEPDASGCVYLMGDGVPVYAELLEKTLSCPVSYVPFHRDRQSAEAVCALAFDLVREGKAVDADAFAPEYLRPFISGPKP